MGNLAGLARRLLLAVAVLAGAPQVFPAGLPQESWRAVPMPPGVRVERTELDGPVFADASGKTLYRWPLRALRNGQTGDPAGASVCLGVRTAVDRKRVV